MNRLATARSPYLRQHADNPVDWYPWGDEAFAEGTFGAGARPQTPGDDGGADREDDGARAGERASGCGHRATNTRWSPSFQRLSEPTRTPLASSSTTQTEP